MYRGSSEETYTSRRRPAAVPLAHLAPRRGVWSSGPGDRKIRSAVPKHRPRVCKATQSYATAESDVVGRSDGQPDRDAAAVDIRGVHLRAHVAWIGLVSAWGSGTRGEAECAESCRGWVERVHRVSCFPRGQAGAESPWEGRSMVGFGV